MSDLSNLSFSTEVENALANNLPLVALESTIISHGMPYPQNVETAIALEQIIRELGCVPATCAIMDGQMKAGLSTDEIDLLGKTGSKVFKSSRRDIPYLLLKKELGATTVAATMIIAEKAGIPIFATGGIGGVHRGAENTMDISADLQELAMTNVAVVSAGAKSILDLGLTLEYLETLGVPVIGYQTDDLPAFYAQSSEFNVNFRLDSAKEISDFLHLKWRNNLKGGVLIANPIPQEFSLQNTEIESIIQSAIQQADHQKIKGKALTPFLLSTIEKMSSGKSLVSNIALIKNNVKLACAIATEMKKN